MTKSVQINVWLDEATAQWLRDYAQAAERSVGSVARLAVKEYLARHSTGTEHPKGAGDA